MNLQVHLDVQVQLKANFHPFPVYLSCISPICWMPSWICAGRLARSKINIPTQANQAVQNRYFVFCILYKNHSWPPEPNEKANNGLFLKLFKALTAHVLSSLKVLGLRHRIFKLDKILLFVFWTLPVYTSNVVFVAEIL